MSNKDMSETLGNILLAIMGAVFFSGGYRAISIVTEDGGKCFIFVDQPANRSAFESALKTAAGEVYCAIGTDFMKYN